MLGVTAPVTLANWVDAEDASGAFTASQFGTESSVQSAEYLHSGTSPGSVVIFSGTGFAPTVSKYFPVAIRTTVDSIAGTVALNGATVSGTDAATLGTALRYRVVNTTATCDITAFAGTSLFVVGTASANRTLTTAQEPGVSNVLASASSSATGTPTGFCFEVTLPAGTASSLQGKTATATWRFYATSN